MRQWVWRILFVVCVGNRDLRYGIGKGRSARTAGLRRGMARALRGQREVVVRVPTLRKELIGRSAQWRRRQRDSQIARHNKGGSGAGASIGLRREVGRENPVAQCQGITPFLYGVNAERAVPSEDVAERL